MQDDVPPAKVEELVEITAAAARRWRERQDEITENRESFRKGLTPDTPERLRKSREHLIRRAVRTQDPLAVMDLAQRTELGKERVLNEINDMVSVEFFERGLEASLSVGRVAAGPSTGTGFLVGPGILLTNNHVLPSREEAPLATFDLDAEENRYGETKRLETFSLCPDVFWATSKELDFTFVAVAQKSQSGVPLSAYGWHPLIAGEGKIRLGEGVSIIQHPRGQVKMVALHNAQLIQLKNDIAEDAFCFYSCDTDRGSSGSPVFNTRWEVIALHHASVPEMDKAGKVLTKAKGGKAAPLGEAIEHPEDVIWVANEGVRVSRLVAGLENTPLDTPAFEAARKELLDLWQQPDVVLRSRPQPASPSLSRQRSSEAGLESQDIGRNSGGTKGDVLEVPITLSIQIGHPKLQTRE